MEYDSQLSISAKPFIYQSDTFAALRALIISRCDINLDMKSSSGVTLIELMIAVALFAIVLTIGIPSFTTVIENNSLATNLNTLIATLNFARSEAVKRGNQISVCKSSDGVNCGGAGTPGYEEGWIVFVNKNKDTTRDVATEELIRVHEELSEGMTLRGNINYKNIISFKPTGEATNIGRFVLCKENNLKKSRVIFIIRTGRVRLASDNDNDNIPEDESGTNITSCTPS